MLRRWPTARAVRAPSWRALSSATNDPSASKRQRGAIHIKGVDTDRVLTALRAFQAQYGHGIVPPSFVVPVVADHDNKDEASASAVWPKETQGLKLGHALKRLYRVLQQPEFVSLREELHATGLSVDGHGDDEATDYKAFYWRATVLAALQTYVSIHDDLYVPRSFIVPEGDVDWPLATWGLRLGQHVHTLRKKAAEDEEDDVRIPTYQREALEQIDFVWDVMEHKWTTKFLPALRRFCDLHGHCNVPQKFIVPSATTATATATSTATATFTSTSTATSTASIISAVANAAMSSDWADLPQCHGYRLGSAVNKLRRGDAFTMQVVRHFDDLQQLGFTFSSFDRNWSDKVLPALETFFQLYGHCQIGAYFVVPERDPRWPRATWGMRVGFIVQNIRSRGDFFPQIMRDSDRLEAIGFVWNRAEVKWNQMVLPALETFVAVHRHANIPASFVVPREAPWPQDAYELRLGRIVSMPSARQRFANYIEIDRKRLERIGFDWGYMDDGSQSEDQDSDSQEGQEDEEDSDSSSDSDSDDN